MFEAIYRGNEYVELHTSAGSVYIDTADIQKKVVRADDPHLDYNVHTIGQGIFVHVADKCIYHGGWVTFCPEMKQGIEEYMSLSQQVDIAFLPVGDKYREAISTEQSLQIAAWIRPKYIVPLYAASDMSGQAPHEHILEFARCIMLEQYGVPKVLRAGQAIVL